MSAHPNPQLQRQPYEVEFVFNPTGVSVGTGTTDLVTLPAETLVLDVRAKVTKADTAGNTGTVAVGDSGSGTRYVAAAAPAATGYMTATGTKYMDTAGLPLRVTVGTGAINATVIVKATLLDLSDR